MCPTASAGRRSSGLAILAAWICGFGLWAALAPLDGAVVASGSFVATGQNKQVQHLEGGIIRDMLVREGDLVEAGQTLVRLDDTPAKAKLRRLVLREYRLLTMQSRLEAQIDSQDRISRCRRRSAPTPTTRRCSRSSRARRWS